jgi:hypothetical protein
VERRGRECFETEMPGNGGDAKVTKVNYNPDSGKVESYDAKYIIVNCVSTEKGVLPQHVSLPQDFPKREAKRARN